MCVGGCGRAGRGMLLGVLIQQCEGGVFGDGVQPPVRVHSLHLLQWSVAAYLLTSAVTDNGVAPADILNVDDNDDDDDDDDDDDGDDADAG